MDIKYEEVKSYEIVNIIEYYDFPLVFISKSPNNKYYFNYYIEELEDGTNKWLFSEISNIERFDILGQRVSMLEFLSKLKDTLRLNHLFFVPTEVGFFQTKYEVVTNNNFDPESFPEEDYYAEFDYLTKTELVRIEEEVVDASKFKVVLKDLMNSHDIGLDLFLDILNNFKRTLKGIASDIGLANENVDLKIDSLQPSSFGVYLKAEQDMFRTSEKSLGKMFELLEHINTSTTEKIEQLVQDDIYSINTLKDMNGLLKNIKENNYTLAVQSTAESDGTPIEVKFERHSYEKVDTISNMLLRTETIREEISIDGTLITINTKRNNFTIKSGEAEYSGKMSRELFNRVKGEEIRFTVPAEISASLIKETTNDLHSDGQKMKYILETFRQI